MTEPDDERDAVTAELAWIRSQIRLFDDVLQDLRGDEAMEWYKLGRIDGREDRAQ